MVPEGSIYFWMFGKGCNKVPLSDVLIELSRAGKIPREKDIQNYWNGWYRSELHGTGSILDLPNMTPSSQYFDMGYEDYPQHPYINQPEIEKRWVPCNKDNKPLFRWSEGCLAYGDAMAWKHRRYMAENTRGCKFIVIDCDGDHDENKLDLDTIMFFSQFMDETHCLEKPKLVCNYPDDMLYHLEPKNCLKLMNMPASYHLTFAVDKVIPTMHFHKAHVDIIGNKANSLRYYKNKIWNGKQPIQMTPEIWDTIREFIRRREDK